MPAPAPRRAIMLQKLRTQLELDLQSKMIKSLLKQGWFATKTSDRFKAGRPDLRIGHDLYGQLDIELKYSLEEWNLDDRETGLSKLQWLKIEEMNKHGMPAVGLVFVEPLNLFFLTTVLRDYLPPPERRVVRLPKAEIVDGATLFVKAMDYLRDLGHHTTKRY